MICPDCNSTDIVEHDDVNHLNQNDQYCICCGSVFNYQYILGYTDGYEAGEKTTRRINNIG